MSTTSAATATPAPTQAGSKAARAPKSPSAPSRSLKDCVANVAKLYDHFSRGSFSKPELANTLEVSASSGPTFQKIFTLKEFGLLVDDSDKFKVTEEFIKLKNTTPGGTSFKRAAYNAIIRNSLFKGLIESFQAKLPPLTTIAMRLEGEKRFNKDRANAIASVLEDSLKYAGVLDQSRNIVVPRDEEGNGGDNTPQDNGSVAAVVPNVQPSGAAKSAASVPPVAVPGALKIEIALKENRMAVVWYPADMTAADAEKVGNVLKAIVA